jgi:hypothetical protein
MRVRYALHEKRDDTNLEFVTDNHVECDNRDDRWAKVLGYFNIGIVLFGLG